MRIIGVISMQASRTTQQYFIKGFLFIEDLRVQDGDRTVPSSVDQSWPNTVSVVSCLSDTCSQVMLDDSMLDLVGQHSTAIRDRQLAWPLQARLSNLVSTDVKTSVTTPWHWLPVCCSHHWLHPNIHQHSQTFASCQL